VLLLLLHGFGEHAGRHALTMAALAQRGIAMYAARFTAEGMGTLEVSELEVRALGTGYALAAARWHLARASTGGGNPSGRFTLVLQRGSNGWSIIADHSPLMRACA
jgi:hypothetical protein